MSWKVGEMWWYYTVRNDIVLINIGLISNWLDEIRIYGCNHSEGNKLDDVFLYRKIDIEETPTVGEILKHHAKIIERRKTMDMKEYQKEVMRTAAGELHLEQVPKDIFHAAIGVATESGEMLDAIKKSLFYGKPLDRVNMIEEIGDVMWYIALMCEELGITIEQACSINIEKLRKRYPDKFTTEKSLNRDLDAERETLEAGAAA